MLTLPFDGIFRALLFGRHSSDSVLHSVGGVVVHARQDARVGVEGYGGVPEELLDELGVLWESNRVAQA